jgi:hypothetical protein
MEVTNIDKIKETLQLINSLATGAGATAGEQEAARSMLDKLLEKYSLTQSDLFNNPTAYFNIKCADALEQKLLLQIIYKVTGKNTECIRGKKFDVIVELTTLERLEAEELFYAYKPALAKELDAFMIAFFLANDIFPKVEVPSDKPGYDLEKSIKIRNMAKTMDQVPVHKQLPGGQLP